METDMQISETDQSFELPTTPITNSVNGSVVWHDGHDPGTPNTSMGSTDEPGPSFHDTNITILCSSDSHILSSDVIEAPALYIESLPGKKIRDKLADSLNVWLGIEAGGLYQIKHIIGLLHNASLILDDVEDGSAVRRGRPSAHMVFGTPQAINSAGYQINLATKEILKLGDIQCIKSFSEEMEKLYVGQGHDLFWTFNTHRPTVNEYISMVDNKTGALFKMLVSLMETKSHATSSSTWDLKLLVTLLGRYFQIRDDYMNLTSKEYTDQKGFCDDLDEGKFSLPLIYAYQNASDVDSSILNHVLLQRHKSDAMSLTQKHLMLDIIKKTGSLRYTATLLRRLIGEIDKVVGRIEVTTGKENDPLRSLLRKLEVPDE
ncbi:hypothetical protein TruAng_011748 [Truncatella angustata]|nr:hypothetical protein TruAng_011748 [Truncatella angustata]